MKKSNIALIITTLLLLTFAIGCNSNLSDELKDLEDEYDELEEDLDHLQKDYDELNRMYTDVNNELALLQETNDALGTENYQLKADVESLQQTISEGEFNAWLSVASYWEGTYTMGNPDALGNSATITIVLNEVTDSMNLSFHFILSGAYVYEYEDTDGNLTHGVHTGELEGDAFINEAYFAYYSPDDDTDYIIIMSMDFEGFYLSERLASNFGEATNFSYGAGANVRYEGYYSKN